MNESIKALKKYIVIDKQHHIYRRDPIDLGLCSLADKFSKQGLSAQERSAKMFSAILDAEIPLILPNEKIVFTRTIKSIPDYFTVDEWQNITSNHFVAEKGEVFNISADYERVLNEGLEARKDLAKSLLNDANCTETIFLTSVIDSIEAIQRLIDRYADEAERQGKEDISETLRAVRNKGAKNFRQAVQLLRILHFCVWASGSYHNTLGRLDQYLLPFYQSDIEHGFSKDEAFHLLEEFFLSCNKDSDLYIGMQQGDNGQSLVLGGRSVNGEYLFNDVSEMALRASYELELIDPKINIRVDSNTPLDVYEKGSQLTKIGLGFPQYSNHDIVIPALKRWGYSESDAHEYVVAACWEFIIPKCGLDIPNIDALSFIDCVCVNLEALNKCNSFEEFYALVEAEITRRCLAMVERHKNLYMKPSPIMSILSDSAIERKVDISAGMKYNNYGIHGTGLATAADSLANIKKFCFDEKSIHPSTLIDALKNNFSTSQEIFEKLRNAPKMGQDDDFVDSLATRLLNSFADALDGIKNERGGIYRAGTGTAMYYVWHGKDLNATPDGRCQGDVLPANYSPSLFMKQKGPISVVKSFSKPDLVRVANGGPLTLEFEESLFRNDESVKKLAMLVRTFVILGGHQLQLNTISKRKLIDAKVHPENYQNLIVRVWGWSGYFVELDECYQDHIINRIEFGVE